ncbi:MAG: hypothetical protein AAGB30_01780 [Pedobacter sp.]
MNIFAKKPVFMLDRNFPIYFIDLPGFHPQLGVETDDYALYDFLSYEDQKLFQPHTRPMTDFMFYPFETISREGRTMQISEVNLIVLFKPETGIAKIRKNHVSLLTAEDIDILMGHFQTGYEKGISAFEREINSTLNFVDISQKQAVVREFINFCQHHLFFEGFATPSCLETLGYIQANLARAVALYQNFKRVSPKEDVTPTDQMPAKAEVVEISSSTNGSSAKIDISNCVSDVVNIWSLLLECWKIKRFQIPQVYRTKDEVLRLLGMMFSEKDGPTTQVPNSEHLFQGDLGEGYIKVLNLLMHSTYKLCGNSRKVNLTEFSAMLKSTFSCYHKSSESSLNTNMKKHVTDTIRAFQNAEQNQTISSALKSLRKIDHYPLS